MPLFGRKTEGRSVLPANIAQRMDYYGRFEFAPQQSEPDSAAKINELVYQPLYPVASADPDTFIGSSANFVISDAV